MNAKWPRRQLLKVIAATGSVATLVFPEMSVGVNAKGNAKSSVNPSSIQWSGLKLKNGREITGSQLADLNKKLQERQDVIKCASGYDLKKATFHAVHHDIKKSNNHLTAGAWLVESHHILIYWGLDTPVDGVLDQVHLFEVDEHGEALHLVAKSANSVSAYGSNVMRVQPSYCGQCGQYGCCPDPTTGYPCYNECPSCNSINIGCIVANCGPCAFACGGGPVACALCFGIWCPFISLWTCCNWHLSLCCEPGPCC